MRAQVWLEFAGLWADEEGDGSAAQAHAIAVLLQASEALPDCVALAFALADAHEAGSQTAEAQRVYDVRRLLLRLLRHLLPLPYLLLSAMCAVYCATCCAHCCHCYTFAFCDVRRLLPRYHHLCCRHEALLVDRRPASDARGRPSV